MRIDHYDWSGGREAMLRFGPEGAPVVVVALPLFEEANRTRAVAAALLRALAARGVAGALPDLPGQGESLVSTEAMTLPSLRAALAAATVAVSGDVPVHLASIRSGALFDDAAAVASRWRWSPQDGAALFRELRRIGQVEVGGDRCSIPDRTSASVAGNLVGARFVQDLPIATVGDGPGAPTRIVRLVGDPRPADRHLPGVPPWRRAEPGNDTGLAGRLADDLAEWVRSCDGC